MNINIGKQKTLLESLTKEIGVMNSKKDNALRVFRQAHDDLSNVNIQLSDKRTEILDVIQGLSEMQLGLDKEINVNKNTISKIKDIIG